MVDNIRQKFPDKSEYQKGIDFKIKESVDIALSIILASFNKSPALPKTFETKQLTRHNPYSTQYKLFIKQLTDYFESKGYEVEHDCGSDQRHGDSWDRIIIS